MMLPDPAALAACLDVCRRSGVTRWKLGNMEFELAPVIETQATEPPAPEAGPTALEMVMAQRGLPAVG